MKTLQIAHLQAAVDAVRLANGGALPIAAYGSLPDRPETGMVAVSPAILPGYRKSMCVRVVTCRGSVAAPGLVAGLIPENGSKTMAMLMQTDDADDPDLLNRLAARELDGKGYAPAIVRADLKDGSSRLALAFIAEIWHSDFWAGAPSDAALMMSRATGRCGSNVAYLAAVIDFETQVFGHVTPELSEISRHLEAFKSCPELDCSPRGEFQSVAEERRSCLDAL